MNMTAFLVASYEGLAIFYLLPNSSALFFEKWFLELPKRQIADFQTKHQK
jgi:hypothetical protein